ncbi:MAG: hypothetical protein JRJ20_17990 [Deltaproteobacteria bacterium]|nr:hypothetical protein [Deltaproteobacteria bacterium]
MRKTVILPITLALLFALAVFSSAGMGPCLSKVRLQNCTEDVSWPTNQTKMFDDGDPVTPDSGLYRVIDFVSSQGTFTVLSVINWGKDTCQGSGNDTIIVRFKHFYEDEGGDQQNRNYVQDYEPTIWNCAGLGFGPWEIYIRYITFYDGNNNGTFDPDMGDTILDVLTSAPGNQFSLTNVPYIRTVNPSGVEPLSRIKIKGGNFGPVQDSSYVKIGNAIYGPGHPKIKFWTSTIIKLKVKNTDCSRFDPTTPGVFFFKKNISVFVEQTPEVFSQSNKFPVKIIKPLSCGGVPYPGP